LSGEYLAKAIQGPAELRGPLLECGQLQVTITYSYAGTDRHVWSSDVRFTAGALES
jgi:hypothetical protein